MTLKTDVTTLASSAIVPKAVALVTVKDMDKVLRFIHVPVSVNGSLKSPRGQTRNITERNEESWTGRSDW